MMTRAGMAVRRLRSLSLAVAVRVLMTRAGMAVRRLRGWAPGGVYGEGGMALLLRRAGWSRCCWEVGGVVVG